MGKGKAVISKNGIERIGYPHAKMKLHFNLLQHTKINSKWIQDINLRSKIQNLLEKTKEMLHDIKFDNDFIDLTTKTQSRK
jgi:hypothetical protein